MKKAVVSHHFWDRPGGGQLVCSAVAYALKVLGFNPVLTSISLFERDKYIDWFGINLQDYEVIPFLKFRLRAFGIYMRLLVWVPMKKAIEKLNPDIVFTDECTYRPVEKLVDREKTLFVEYIHFPIEVSILEEYKGSGLYYGEDPYLLERYSRFPMNIYWWGYAKLLPLFLRRNPFEVASLVLTNSKWTAEIAGKIYGERPQVLNPPIAPNVEIAQEPKVFEERENAIVMLGRFSEEKRYHWVVEEVMPRLRRELGGVKLYVFGGARTKTSMMYLSEVGERATRRGLKVSNNIKDLADIYLVPDAPRKVINNVMDKAKVFLHATINEHWGIAPAEAMARGLPIVVHKSGGTWSDLAVEGEYGLGYNNIEEVIELLSKLLNDENVWRHYSKRSILKAGDLTIIKFIDRLKGLIKA
ncbi:MAG: glycosyltransferase [Candidatus Nezhaarchaeales archaeon]